MEKTKRFATTSQSAISHLLDSKYTKSSKVAESYSFNLFLRYIETSSPELWKRIGTDAESALKAMPSEDLDTNLMNFFASVRKADGSMLKKASFQSIRYGINRHLTQKCGLDITNKHLYPRSNDVTLCVIKQLKKEGFANTEYFKALQLDEVRTVVAKLEVDNAQQLQWLLFFYIQLFFCRRGVENLQNFTKKTFSVNTDESGAEYLVQTVDELTKNHRENDDNLSINGTMLSYKQLGNKCPITVPVPTPSIMRPILVIC